MTTANNTDETTQKECIFCKIIQGDIPAVKVYEDSEILAFMDIKPNHKGHTLIIPKDHIENIYGIPAETAARLMIVTQKIAVAIKNAVDADGLNISMNNESAAGQIIWHAHIHVIPRYNEDGGYTGKYTYIADEMESIAQKIQAEL